MRIYCKASPMFKNPDPNIKGEDKNKFIRTKPGFQTVPDWVANDPTFKSSVACGVIQVVAMTAQTVVPGAPNLSKAEKKALAKSIGHDIELIDACTSEEDITSIMESIVNKDSTDVLEAIAEKKASFEKA